MSALLPPLGRRSPALAGCCSPAQAGCRSPVSPCHLAPMESDLLCLRDLDDREEEDDIEDDFSLLNASLAVSSLSQSTQSASAHAATASEGASLVPVLSTPVRMGGRTPRSEGRGGWEGWGGWGMPGYKSKQQGFFCRSRSKGGDTIQGFHPQERGHTPIMYLPGEGR
jgi:hypothetical protein